MKERSGIHPVVAALVAVVVVVGIVGGYVWFNTKPPVHVGQLVSITAYPIHRELSTGSALGGLAGARDVYDEEIVVANVTIKSQTQMPLFLHDMWADVTLADGTVDRSNGASTGDYRAVFVAYPALAASKTQPILRGITMTPGQQLQGQIVFHYPITAQQWDQRKDFRITVQFINQKDLVIDNPTAPVTTVPSKT